MTVRIPLALLEEIRRHAEAHYPEEGAGLLLGSDHGDERRAEQLWSAANVFEAAARGRRYMISPQDVLAAEREAERRGMEVVGVFHSHPDHPAEPSEFDWDMAWPWFTYVITRVERGKAAESRAWRLAEDRGDFVEERLITDGQPDE